MGSLTHVSEQCLLSKHAYCCCTYVSHLSNSSLNTSPNSLSSPTNVFDRSSGRVSGSIHEPDAGATLPPPPPQSARHARPSRTLRHVGRPGDRLCLRPSHARSGFGGWPRSCDAIYPKRLCLPGIRCCSGSLLAAL